MDEKSPMRLPRRELSGIRLLALDLDGTLLNSKKKITPRTFSALSCAAAVGIQIVPVTGRPLSGLPEELLEIPGIHYAVTSNGAVTTELRTGRKLRCENLKAETAWELLQIPLERGWIYSVFIDGLGYCDPGTCEQLYERFRGHPYERYVLKSRRPEENMEALVRAAEEGVENVWLIPGSEAECGSLIAASCARWDVRAVVTGRCDLEFGAPGADKGLALKALRTMLGIGKESVLAAGDSGNDLGLLSAAGISVAMGNGTEAIRRAAALVTGDNEHDGLAPIIEAILGQ